jgi:arylformamidase
MSIGRMRPAVPAVSAPVVAARWFDRGRQEGCSHGPRPSIIVGMSEWIDLTRVLVDGMAGWPGDPPLRLRRVADLERDGVMVTEICTSAHIGTHIDAPLHCVACGSDVAGIDLGRLCGPAVIVDVSGQDEARAADLVRAGVGPGDRVLIKSGAEPGQPTTALSVEAAEWAVRQGVPLVGIDGLSPDRADASHLPVHHILLEAGIPILEGLDLSRVSPGRYELIALPLRICGCEASPVRAMVRQRPRHTQELLA